MYLYKEDEVERKKDELYLKVDFNTEQAIFAGFTFDGKLFSMSLSAQINWSNLLFIPEAMYPITINTKNDNDSYSLTYANRQSFYGTVLNFKNTCLQTGNTIKNDIRNCTTLEELQIIEDTL